MRAQMGDEPKQTPPKLVMPPPEQLGVPVPRPVVMPSPEQLGVPVPR